MMTPSKYKRQYYMPPVKCMKWAEKEYVDKAPIWCSVDLRRRKSGTCDPDEPGAESGIFQASCKDWF